ncbi:MAG: metalloregulator ArsR/SmtB family transcription factor [Pseudomonadota bacterium]
MVETLKAVAEPSRLRVLKLLRANDLTVSDLTMILGQSQPRVSRHLKLLQEAGLIHRWQEGSWALFRVTRTGAAAALLPPIFEAVLEADDIFLRDQERLTAVKTERRERAKKYFAANAQSWDDIRSLHVADEVIEAELSRIVGEGPFNHVLDIGTGTGRLLEVLAPKARSAIGIDSSREMLNVARANLDASGVANAEVRYGDAYDLSLGRDQFDLIVIHQVLHFLDNPQAAIREAVRALAPSGRLIIVDFAPHANEHLRDQHQHQRLGFSTDTIQSWLEDADLRTEPEITISSEVADQSDPLTVMIWTAQDTRMLIADDNYSQKRVA